MSRLLWYAWYAFYMRAHHNQNKKKIVRTEIVLKFVRRNINSLHCTIKNCVHTIVELGPRTNFSLNARKTRVFILVSIDDAQKESIKWTYDLNIRIVCAIQFIKKKKLSILNRKKSPTFFLREFIALWRDKALNRLSTLRYRLRSNYNMKRVWLS